MSHIPLQKTSILAMLCNEEVATHLQELIRLDTTNPPGNETPAAEYVASALANDGIEALVLEHKPGRGSAVARLRGTGEAPALLLMSHLDVVPAQPDDWSHPPFAGTMAGGYLWGRGAVDTKNATSIQMAAMQVLARSGIRLKRDLLLSAMADEEIAGGGAQFLATEHPEWVTAEYALNEGGGEALLIGGQTFYGFQVAQKGGVNVRMVAHAESGHSSVPYPESAISKLSAAIVRLKQNPLPHRVIPTTIRFFEGVADRMPNRRLARAARDMLDPGRQEAAAEKLGCDRYVERMLLAMLRNVAEATMINAGYKSNVMPAEAEALISARGLPGIRFEELLREIRQVVGPELTLEPQHFVAGLEFDLPDDDPLLDAARHAIGRTDPEGTVLPYLSCGGTDAMYLEPLGTTVVGFTPMRSDPAGHLLQLAHANDERISVDNLVFGTQTLVDLICRLNGVPSVLS